MKNLKLKKTTNHPFLFFLLSFICTLLLAETALHFTPYKSSLKQIILPQFYLQADEAASYDISENFPPTIHRIADGYAYHIWSNQIGCFDKPYRKQEEYILLTGDSFIWGYMAFEHKYGTLLEHYLGYRVVQAGVIGYGTRQETFKIKKIIERTKKIPALIIIGYCIQNDFIDDWLFPRQTVIDGFPIQNVRIIDASTWRKEVIPRPQLTEELKIWEQAESSYKTHFITRAQNWLKNNSIIYYMFEKLIGTLTHKKNNIDGLSNEKYASFEDIMEKGYKPQDGWDEHLRNLSEIKKLCAQNNIPLLIVLIPPKEQIYSPLSSYKFHNEVITALENFFKKEDIRYLNLRAAFQKYANYRTSNIFGSHGDLYWRADGHWNKDGNKLASAITAEYILNQGILKIQDKEKRWKILKEETKNLWDTQ